MPREQDPSVGNIGDIEVEQQPRRSRRLADTSDGDGGGPPPDPGGPPRRPDRPGRRWPWVLVVLILLILILAQGAWTYLRITSLRQQLHTVSTQTDRRLENLEAVLAATGENLSEAANSIQETLAMHMSEIRKLWHVSNERNRRWIKENDEHLQALESALAEVRSQLNSLQDQVASQNAITELKGTVAQLQQQVQSLQEKLASLDAAVQSVTQAQGKTQTQLRLLVDTVQKLQEGQAQLREQLNNLQASGPDWQKLQKRLDKIEAAIQAFDAYRRQVNQRLRALEQ